jgi:hypothetical protein
MRCRHPHIDSIKATLAASLNLMNSRLEIVAERCVGARSLVVAAIEVKCLNQSNIAVQINYRTAFL